MRDFRAFVYRRAGGDGPGKSRCLQHRLLYDVGRFFFKPQLRVELQIGHQFQVAAVLLEVESRILVETGIHFVFSS